MIKICLTVRNRLGMTKKCITAIKKHSFLEHQIFVYDNLTTLDTKAHFEYFYKLYEGGHISQVTFNTKESTFNAFSKAAASNQFGHTHEDDPQKKNCDFLLFLDNDIIVTPGFDGRLVQAWKEVKLRRELNDIKVIGQLPGGICKKTLISPPLKSSPNATIGLNGGSGLWSVAPDFFKDVGYLPLRNLVGHNKKHDQMYWTLLSRRTNGKNYILGLEEKLGIHCGKYAGSMCNILNKGGDSLFNQKKDKLIQMDEKISNMTFEQFYEMITKDKEIMKGW